MGKKKEVISNTPNADEDTISRNKPSVADDSVVNDPWKLDVSEAPIQNEDPGELFFFQRKQKRGATIDVWWLYDDGGLTLLLPYILSTRRHWSNCRLRVFALANKDDQLESEQLNMAGMLSKFRIDYSDLQIVPSISKKPQEATQQLFESMINEFRYPENDETTTGKQVRTLSSINYSTY